MTAGHRKLSNLTLIVDRNGLQQGARTEDTAALEPLADKWRAFGWDVVEIDGHDHNALLSAFAVPVGGRSKPLCVIARTHKGRESLTCAIRCPGITESQTRHNTNWRYRRLADECREQGRWSF